MELKRISYSEFAGGSQEWTLDDLTLRPTNLIVGKNATGKSRCLKVLNSLAKLLLNDKLIFTDGHFDAEFESDNNKMRYVLEIKNAKVVQESFELNNANLMTRGQGGAGQIMAEGSNEQGDTIGMMNFQTPETSLAAVVRRDEIQHSFLEHIHDWASKVTYYPFGTALGQDHYALLQKKPTGKFDIKNTSLVIGFFRKGMKDFGDNFINAIKEDFKKIDYHIDEIGIKKPTRVPLPENFEGEPVGLYVKETDLQGITEQSTISQGMFRVLSLIIQINYCQMALKPSCIIIDDIGEGLDFDRSVRLINLLIEKASKGGIQLIMSTNDRFVMNSVPLEIWTVLKRDGNHCHVYDYANSEEKFNAFKFTGMNNFDFLQTNFIDEDLSENE